MSVPYHHFSHCFVDESIHDAHGFAVTSMVFANSDFQGKIAGALRSAGLRVPDEEYKSSARMDRDARMPVAREAIMQVLKASARVALVIGPFQRVHLGRQVLQALQSVLVRNGIEREGLRIYFDRELFPSQAEASRLHGLFHALRGATLLAHQDSKQVFGIQAADAAAHTFAQVVKAATTGHSKMVDIGGPGTGYVAGTLAPLDWALLMNLRFALLTRPFVYDGGDYPTECDPAVLDPQNDDPVTFGQHPVLLGWGVQVAPESEAALRANVEESLGKLWLGCVH